MMSCKVTIPTLPPNSSITTAKCACRSRKCVNSFSSGSISGTTTSSFFDCQQARLWLVQLHEHVFDVDQADRAVKILRAERKTGVARRLGALKVLTEREVGVEVYNLSARCHYL